MTATTKKRLAFEFDVQEGWSAFAFLAMMLIIVTGSINEAGYDPDLDGLVLVTLGALIGGLMLAKSRFPGILAHLVSAIYGIAWNAFVISYRLPATFTPREKLLEMGFRIADWVRDTVLGGELGTDPLMFAVVMSILAWILTYLAVWTSFRSHILWATLLPCSITLTINLYYGPERIGFFIVPFMLLALLFTARLTLYLYERDWRKHHVRFSTDMAYTFLRYGTILALISIILAWVIPTAATNEDVEVFFSRFSEPWDRVKSEWIRLFSTLQSERTVPTYASFGGTLVLGGPVNLGNATLMDVQSSTGRYWRAAIYDVYDGSGWTYSGTRTAFPDAGMPPGESIPYEARRTITQTYTLYMPDTTQLFALGQPEKFSMPARIDYYAAPSERETPIVESIVLANSRHKLGDVESYMAISTIPSADIEAMRTAGNDYPEWIDRYLQLPDTVPQRVYDLAQEITAPHDNAFDKSAAIESYLREYTYNQSIPMPPLGIQDRVDYFLFESKEGYCNYYASSMVVLARAVGIPARMAAGYTRGEYDSDSGSYRVRENNSHAWVEVFLPRFGWIEFEPTASEPIIVRPRTFDGGANVPPGDQSYWEDYLNNIPQDQDYYGSDLGAEAFAEYMAQQRREQRIRTLTRVGGIVLIGALIIVAAWWLGRRQMNEDRPAQTFYEKMIKRGTWWGLPMQPAQTPNEYGYTLAAELGDVDATRLVERITMAYVGERFGKKNPARFQPDFAWRDLRSMLFRWGIGYRWRKLWEKKQ
ncbi:MAG: hypothetical protein JW934_04130 [Anaerolineae bacterium]|nr:hypothetical protein [Anaerolineae bacterium]